LTATILLVACLGCQSGGAGPARSPSAAPASTIPRRAATPTVSPTSAPPITLGRLFHPPPGQRFDPSRLRTIVATGDVIPARNVNLVATQKGDFLWPFRPTADIAHQGDLRFINLESPLFAGCPPMGSGTFTFCGDSRFVDGLTLIGTTVANLANNHLTNYGAAGTTRTVELLQSHGIQTCGLGPAAVVEVRGLRFAFLGYTGVGQAIDREAVRAGIAQARQLADLVVVQFHWGKEYERQPLADPAVPTPDDPIQIGHLAIDAGADIVIGNHPHWYQGVEVYHERLITYAHGNYVFDQMWSDETREGVIGSYTFYDRRLIAASWRPLRIYDYGQARWMDEPDASAALRTMEDASRQLARGQGEPAD
jgi:poly-gamma-glutamate synthesis protein (capsule biosynthesis protein)